MSARRPLDDRRKAIFLRVLAETGSVSAASAAATPHSDGGKEAYRAGYRTFLDETRRDPDFAQAVAEAKQHALGELRVPPHLVEGRAVAGSVRLLAAGGMWRCRGRGRADAAGLPKDR